MADTSELVDTAVETAEVSGPDCTDICELLQEGLELLGFEFLDDEDHAPILEALAAVSFSRKRLVTVLCEGGCIRVLDGKTEIVGWLEEEWRKDPKMVYTIAQAIVVGLTTGADGLKEVLGLK